MLTILQYHLDSGKVSNIAQETVASSLHKNGLILWLDLPSPTDEELQWLQETFSIHPLVIDDLHTRQERAKLERYETYYFFVAHALHYDEQTQQVSTQEVDLIVDRDYLISVHTKPIQGIDEALHRLREAHMPHEATTFLFYLIIDAIVDNYFPPLDAMGEQIDDLDAAVTEHPDREALHTIFHMRRNLLYIRRTVGPLRDALNQLIREEESEQLFPGGSTRASVMCMIMCYA